MFSLPWLAVSLVVAASACEADGCIGSGPAVTPSSPGAGVLAGAGPVICPIVSIE